MNERRRAAAHVFVADLDTPELAPDDHHHLVRVLRLGVGEVVTVSDGRGGWRPTAHQGDGRLDVVAPTQREPRRTPVVGVAFAVMKGDRPEWVVQKLTELGVDRIVPLHTARSVVRWDGARASKHLVRLRRVAREAAMQSRQVWLPEVEDVADLASVARRPGTVLAEPGSPVLTASSSADERLVVIGPEGGFTDDELASGPPRVGLPGDGILRAETAAITAGVLLVTQRGDFVGN